MHRLSDGSYTPSTSPVGPTDESIVWRLFHWHLASALLRRPQESKRPEDVKSSVIFFAPRSSPLIPSTSHVAFATYLVIVLTRWNWDA